jgi:hypothetical protein
MPERVEQEEVEGPRILRGRAAVSGWELRCVQAS